MAFPSGHLFWQKCSVLDSFLGSHAAKPLCICLNLSQFSKHVNICLNPTVLNAAYLLKVKYVLKCISRDGLLELKPIAGSSKLKARLGSKDISPEQQRRVKQLRY